MKTESFISFLWVYYIIPFGFSWFWKLGYYIFTFKLRCLAIKIDEGSVPEMRTWSIFFIRYLFLLKMVYTS